MDNANIWEIGLMMLIVNFEKRPLPRALGCSSNDCSHYLEMQPRDWQCLFNLPEAALRFEELMHGRKLILDYQM